MNESPLSRITPWVGRLLAINAVVLLLQQTIFTSETLAELVTFAPGLAFQRPWTFFTYIFVHGGLLHLLGNSLGLFVFGPIVENRLGSTRFLLYYLYCGVCGAVFSLALYYTGFVTVAPFVGASGAILGLAYGFAKYLPDAELMIFPIPFPIKAQRMVWLLAAMDVIGAMIGGGQIAHYAHLGGLGGGWLFFALQGITHPTETPRLPMMRPRVAVPSRGAEVGQQPVLQTRSEPVAAAPTPAAKDNSEAIEIDRVLDKISATGIASLTPAERKFLDSVAERKRGGQNN
ncbi:MAG: rhomboid family intramembrane serine protease [Gemmatimonadota bacterium]